MAVVIILSIYMVEVIKYHLAFRIVYREKLQRKWLSVVGASLLMVYMLCAGGDADRDYVVAYMINVLMTAFAMSGNIKDKIVKPFLLWVILTSIDEMPAAVFYHVEASFSGLSNVHNWLDLITSIWGLFALIVICKYMDRKNGNKMLSRRLVMLIVVANGIAVILTIAGLNFARKEIENQAFQYIFDFLVSIASISLCLLCWLLIYFRNQDEEKTRSLALEWELLEEQEHYYQILLQKEENTRKFRHDMENHLLCLNDLAGRGNFPELKSYLEEISGQMAQIHRCLYTTGDELLDVILNDKLDGLKDGIQIRIVGKVTRALSISKMDVCTIFSNIFQNAVEELKWQEHGWFLMQIQSGKVYTEFVVQNSVRAKVQMKKNGLPRTTKNKTDCHGFGLQNVKNVVEKNQGYFQVLSQNDYFEVNIQFHN